MEERLSSVTFAYILASLRGSSLCLYSGCYGGAPLTEHCDPELQNKGIKSKNEVWNIKSFYIIFIEHTLGVNVKKRYLKSVKGSSRY